MWEAIYQAFRLAGVIVGQHNGDLFVLDCADTREILNQWPIVKGISVRYPAHYARPSDEWIWQVPLADSGKKETYIGQSAA